MRRLLLSIAGIFAIITFIASAQPKLVIEGGNKYYFGIRDRSAGGNPSYAKIKFFNVGDSALTIQNPKPTCGCTTAPLDKNKVESGDFAVLSVKLYLNVSRGPYTKTIKINSDDAANPDITYYISADVNQDEGFGNLQLKGEDDKQFVTLALMNKGKDAKGTMKIKNNTSKDIEITSVELEPATMKINLKAGTKIAPGEGNELAFELTAKSSELGEFNGNIKLATTDDKMKTLTIPVWGWVMK